MQWLSLFCMLHKFVALKWWSQNRGFHILYGNINGNWPVQIKLQASVLVPCPALSVYFICIGDCKFEIMMCGYQCFWGQIGFRVKASSKRKWYKIFIMTPMLSAHSRPRGNKLNTKQKMVYLGRPHRDLTALIREQNGGWNSFRRRRGKPNFKYTFLIQIQGCSEFQSDSPEHKGKRGDWKGERRAGGDTYALESQHQIQTHPKGNSQGPG